MKKTKISISLMLLLFSISSSAIEVKKHRDQLRFGYGLVQECNTYTINSDGSLVLTGSSITCRESGDLHCRQGASNVAPPSGDLDNFPQLTSAERTSGNNMIYNAEVTIESGQANGLNTQTITFISTSEQSYYRTFSINQSTNEDGSVDSTFTISDPINN